MPAQNARNPAFTAAKRKLLIHSARKLALSNENNYKMARIAATDGWEIAEQVRFPFRSLALVCLGKFLRT